MYIVLVRKGCAEDGMYNLSLLTGQSVELSKKTEELDIPSDAGTILVLLSHEK